MNALQDLVSALGQALHWLWRHLRGRVVTAVGGTARTRVVVLFAGVLALSSAQISTIGAVAPQLESSLHLDNTQIGLLNSVTLIVAAVAVIPVGLLVDRVKRIPVLSISIVLWSIATILGAIAPDYGTLLITRVALGAVSAIAGPAIASLTGDYFPSRERGRVYGYILTGEILGTAVGFVVCGNLSGLVGWRPAFWLLAIPGFFLARELWRTVPEPARGGYSRLERGVRSLNDLRHHDPTEEQGPAQRPPDAVYAMAEKAGYRPDPKLILRSDPDKMSLPDAVRYIISIPTNLLLIVSSSLGYFFFAGLETFATVFVRSHFHVSQGEATLVLGVLVVGAVMGTLAVGPVSDFITRRGHLGARVWVPAVCNIGAGLMLIPGFLTHSLTTAIPFCFLGTALISAANPPLDAARLDIMPSGLWGRAESTRTFLRSIAQAVAPLVFGAVSDLIAGFTPHGAIVGTHTGQIASGTGTGLQVSFLIMLISLFASGWFLWRARPTYPRDVVTAGEGWTPGARGGGGGRGEAATWGASSDVAPGTAQRADDEAPTAIPHSAGDGAAHEAPTAIQRPGADEAPTAIQRPGADEAPTAIPRPGADEAPLVTRRTDPDDDPDEPLVRPR